MEGEIKVSYTVMCSSDVHQEVTLSALLQNEKIAKTIKNEFAKGLRNVMLDSYHEATIHIKTEKTVYEFTVQKDDFADILELAEEDARKHKRLKKECEGIELVDIVTIN